MLTESYWLITVLKVLLNLSQEEFGVEDAAQIRVLSVSFIGWVNVVEFFGADGSPSLRRHELIIEDFSGVRLDKTSVTIVGDTTTIVTLGNLVLDGLPWDFALNVEGIGHFSNAAHIVCDLVFTNLVV